MGRQKGGVESAENACRTRGRKRKERADEKRRKASAKKERVW